MPAWDHPPHPSGATSRELATVVRVRLHHLVDAATDHDVKTIGGQVLRLIVELIEDRGERRDFDEQWDRPHDDA